MSNSSTSVRVAYINASSTPATTVLNSVATNSNLPQTVASGDFIFVRFKVPILGWSSSVQMSDGYDGRVIAASGIGGDTGNTIASNTDAILPISTVATDTAGMVSGNTVVIKSAGYYRVNAIVRMGSSNTNFTNTHTARVLVNGVSTLVQGIQGSGAYSAAIALRAFSITPIDNIIPLKAGDVLTFVARSDMATNTFGFVLATWSVEKVSGPSAIAASETIFFRGTNGAGTSIGTSATIVPFASSKDTHGAWNGTGFVVPAAGDYEVETFLRLASINTASFSVFTYLNGAQYSVIQATTGNGTAAAYAAGGSDTLPNLKAGDVISVYAQSGTAGALATPLQNNHVNIKRIGL